MPEMEVVNHAIQDRSLPDVDKLEMILNEHWLHLMSILSSTKAENRRSIQFFKSHKDRLVLLYEIRTGPFTFEEYYCLSDLLSARIQSLVDKDPNMLKIFVQNTGAGITGEDTTIGLLLRQYISIVLLPELIERYVDFRYPGVDPVTKTMELSMDNQKDYVEYLLSLRDMAKWGRRKIKY